MLWEQLKNEMLKHPNSVLCEEGVSMTYEEAVTYAEMFATNLTAPCYAILCQSDIISALATLSCIAAEKTAVPLSRRYGEIHCKRILQTISPRYVLEDSLGELRIVEIEGQEYDEPVENVAFIMCTSGTTGTPKGVMLSQTNIYSNIRDIKKYFVLSPKDRILITRPLYHCAVLTGEFLLALFAGADIYFYNKPFNIGRFISIINENKITVTCGTPTFFNSVSILSKKTLPLKKVAISGECLNASIVPNIRHLLPNAQIFHVYGLTEASPRVAYLEADKFDSHPGMLNVFLDSVRSNTFDEYGNFLIIGKEGELVIKGDNVMLGYYKNQAATDEKIRNGWLHTGDIISIENDGFFKVLGRKDNMIIYAGMNIYPSEIEESLKQDPRVEEVLAYGEPNPYSGQTVAIKIKGKFKNKKEVEEIAHKMLPQYEFPTKIEIVEDIPKNATGKIIRNKCCKEGQICI